MRKIVAALALIALIGYGGHLFRQVTELDLRLSSAEQTNRNLEEEVGAVRQQAERSLDAIETAEQLHRRTQQETAAEADRAEQAEHDRTVAEAAQQRALETIAASQTAAEETAAGPSASVVSAPKNGNASARRCARLRRPRPAPLATGSTSRASAWRATAPSTASRAKP